MYHIHFSFHAEIQNFHSIQIPIFPFKIGQLIRLGIGHAIKMHSVMNFNEIKVGNYLVRRVRPH